jgi:hypothetical protein
MPTDALPKLQCFCFLGLGKCESSRYGGHHCTSRGMDVERLAREMQVLGENPASEPICPTQIPRDLTWARTRPAAVEASD